MTSIPLPFYGSFDLQLSVAEGRMSVMSLLHSVLRDDALGFPYRVSTTFLRMLCCLLVTFRAKE
jgi:hypothetical protein